MATMRILTVPVLVLLLTAPVAAQSSAVVAVFANVWSLDAVSPEIGTPRVFPFAPVSPGDLFAGAFPAPPPLPPTITEAAAFGFPNPAPIHELDAVALANSPCVPFPPPPTNDLRIEFSIDRASVGAAPAITAQTGVGGDGAAADIFQYVQVAGAAPFIGLRNNNAPPAPNSFFLTPGLGAGQSNIDAWYSQGGFQIGNTVPLPPLLPTPGNYFISFGAGTPAPAGLAAVDPGVIYTPDGAGGMMPSVFVLNGLLPGDDIDALSIGPRVAYFSLSRFSPSVAAGFFSAADVLKWTPAGGLVVWAPAAALGLLPTDDLDALFVWDPGTAGDVDGHVSNIHGPGTGAAAQGAYFDVQADDDIVVRALDVALDASPGASVAVDLWVTDSGPAASSLGSPANWIKIAADTVLVPPDGQPARIDRLLDVALVNGSTRGFFVTAAGGVLGVEPTATSNETIASGGAARLLGGSHTTSSTPGQGVSGNGVPRMTLYLDLVSSGPRTRYRLSQSLNGSVVRPLGSVSCNYGSPNYEHDDNGYLRFYNLTAEGETRSSVTIDEVLFGVEGAVSGSGNQPVTLRLFSTPAGNKLSAGFTLLHQENFTVADGTSFVRRAVPPLTFVNDPNVDLVVEIHTPSGLAAGNSFFTGTNDRGETAPTWLRSVGCGIIEPVTYASIGFFTNHAIIDIGYTAGDCNGTFEDLRLLSGAAGLDAACTKHVTVGDVLGIALSSPGGTFAPNPFLIIASLGPPGQTYVDVSGGFGPLFLPPVGALGIVAGDVPLPPFNTLPVIGNGFIVSVPLAPFVSGSAIGLQGVALGLPAANGVYATSAHHVLTVL